jgi:hypothetical protein
MYVIHRSKTMPKMFRNATFRSYDAARAAVRKWIRNHLDLNTAWFTPSLTEFGFSIRRS